MWGIVLTSLCQVIPYLLIHGTYCGSSPVHKQIDFIYDGIPRGLFDILLMVLAIYRFTMHAIETRRMMGRQKINKYMILLLEHSILYFIVYARFSPEDHRTECSR